MAFPSNYRLTHAVRQFLTDDWNDDSRPIYAQIKYNSWETNFVNWNYKPPRFPTDFSDEMRMYVQNRGYMQHVRVPLRTPLFYGPSINMPPSIQYLELPEKYLQATAWISIICESIQDRRMFHMTDRRAVPSDTRNRAKRLAIHLHKLFSRVSNTASYPNWVKDRAMVLASYYRVARDMLDEALIYNPQTRQERYTEHPDRKRIRVGHNLNNM